MSLRKLVTRTVTSSATMVATVENIAQIGNTQLATVRLQGSGNRMTNLQVVGGKVTVGDTVIVDTSSGMPYIRPNTPTPTTEDSEAYTDMNDSLGENSDDDNPDTDEISPLDKILETAGKALVTKLWASRDTEPGGVIEFDTAIVNTLSASIISGRAYYFSNYTGIQAPISGIYLIQAIIGIGESTEKNGRASLHIGVDDIDDLTNGWSDEEWDEWYYIPTNGIGGVMVYNIQTVIYADSGDGMFCTYEWESNDDSIIVSDPNQKYPLLTAVLLRPGNSGYNPYMNRQ